MSTDLTSDWDFESAHFELDDDLVAVGADLEPGTLVAAYSAGIFPMGLGEGGAPPLGWWSPVRRGVLERGGLRRSRSLRRAERRFEVTVDADFDGVVAGCADPSRDGAWITDDIAAAYRRLHGLGLAHSVEVWDDDGLAGGLYGLALGGLFAGESMFHRATDASKVALCALVDRVFASDDARLIDVQWATPHLRSLGVTEWDRPRYREHLTTLLEASPITELSPAGTLAKSLPPNLGGPDEPHL